jgi:hypothetical protein
VPYHSDSCNRAARRLLLWGLALVTLVVGLLLYRRVLEIARWG